MTPLDKSLVFYFRYQPEMLRWYWKQQELQDDDIDQKTLEMINAVGDHCCREIGNLLTEFGTIAEKHFESIGHCSLEKMSTKKWTISCGIWPGNKNRPQNDKWKMQVGFDIPKTKSEIIPWIWGIGKNEAEKKMRDIFGDTLIPSSQVDMPTGRIALAKIHIPTENNESTEIDRDDLLKQIEQAFSPITQPKFENVYSLLTA